MIVNQEKLNEIAVRKSTRLVECENIIRNGMHIITLVADALVEIRDSKLYPDNHKTFQDYCKNIWGFGDNYARKIIDSAKVINNITVQIVPLRESQTRELSKLPADQQEPVWKEVQKITGKEQPTAKEIKSLVDSKKPKKNPDENPDKEPQEEKPQDVGTELAESSTSKQFKKNGFYYVDSSNSPGSIDCDLCQHHDNCHKDYNFPLMDCNISTNYFLPVDNEDMKKEAVVSAPDNSGHIDVLKAKLLKESEKKNNTQDEPDNLYEQAELRVITTQKINSSDLQKHFNISYKKAMSLITIMEQNKVIKTNEAGKRIVIAPFPSPFKASVVESRDKSDYDLKHLRIDHLFYLARDLFSDALGEHFANINLKHYFEIEFGSWFKQVTNENVFYKPDWAASDEETDELIRILIGNLKVVDEQAESKPQHGVIIATLEPNLLWFKTLSKQSDSMCITSQKLSLLWNKHEVPNDDYDFHEVPIAIFYFKGGTPLKQSFRTVFEQIGAVWE